jgi:ribonuclease P protein component
VQTEHSGLPKTNAFGKNVRLRNAAEFRRVYEKGAKRISRSFVLFAMCNGLSFSRFGLTAPRRLGKAHERNRIKRRIREILRTSGARMPVGFDFVVNPRRPAAERPYAELRTELMALLTGEK